MVRPGTSKSERINLRLDAGAKHKIEQAASVEGKTVGGFILTSTLACADEAVRAHDAMFLGKPDAEVFFDAILDPPAPNEKLRRAM